MILTGEVDLWLLGSDSQLTKTPVSTKLFYGPIFIGLLKFSNIGPIQ